MLDGAPDAQLDPARADGRRLALGLVLWAALAAVSLIGGRPPEVLPSDAPVGVASGARALQVLRRLARDDDERVSPPRPVGSAANERCRERLLVECRRVGLFPEVDVRFAVSTHENVAGTTRNVVARVRGSAAITEPGRAILCMAHYDSVGAGPGIADDLAGVASLVEIARALRAGGGLRRDVIFLFEDAEEHGLLGAEAFAAQHPWARDVGAVINLEARGMRGASRMFETGAGNAWAVEAFAGTVSNPSANSVSVEVYRRMPNDTDYTVWRQRGVPGLNFAFIGDVTGYHTPLDDIERLSLQSVQHHASNVLAAVRALDDAVFPVERGGSVTSRGADAVFFDVAGRWLVTLRVPTVRVLAALTLLLALLGVGRAIAAGAMRGPRVVLGIAVVGAGLSLAALVAVADGALMGRLGAPRVAFPAHPGPIAVSLVGATLGGLFLVSGGIARLVSAAECGAAGLLAFSFGGLALAWQVPGAAYLIVLPAGVLAVGAALMRTGGDVDARWGNASLVALAIAALLWTALHPGLLAAFGVGSPLVVGAPLLIVGAFALPLLVRGWATLTPWAAAGAIALALVAAAFAGTLETHSVDRPGRLNIVHIQAEGEPTRWQVMGMTDPIGDDASSALQAALGLPDRAVDSLVVPWPSEPLFAARTQPVDDEGPAFEVISQRPTRDGGVIVEGCVRSARGGDQLVLVAHGALEMRVGGVQVDPDGFGFLGPRTERHSFELTFAAAESGALEVHDKRFGFDGLLTARAERLLEARPVTLVPSNDGDGSILISRYALTRGEGDEMLVSRMRAKPDPIPAEGDVDR